MTTQKKLSSLSIAVAAILAAAMPCFAQAQPGDPRVEVSAPAAISVVEASVALNRENPAPKGITEATTASKRPTLSLAMFEESSDQFTLRSGHGFITTKATVYEPGSKKQFVDDNYAGPAPRPRVTFVPSRGCPKLPN